MLSLPRGPAAVGAFAVPTPPFEAQIHRGGDGGAEVQNGRFVLVLTRFTQREATCFLTVRAGSSSIPAIPGPRNSGEGLFLRYGYYFVASIV